MGDLTVQLGDFVAAYWTGTGGLMIQRVINVASSNPQVAVIPPSWVTGDPAPVAMIPLGQVVGVGQTDINAVAVDAAGAQFPTKGTLTVMPKNGGGYGVVFELRKVG